MATRAAAMRRSLRNGCRSFARLVAVDANVAEAAQVIIEKDWSGNAEALACAVGTATALSARERQDVDRFAELVVGSLEEAGVSQETGQFAFARALMPRLENPLAEVRVAFAQWRYLQRLELGSQHRRPPSFAGGAGNDRCCR